ncbi:fluoride efflux transporter CrcB [Peribacillus asahii]|uniref:fluoride efflux transporter CrcB n=1 Tax=Peribacillus asahii TaxID=228899 RepID=UPI0020798F0D|nr:fluoride efflux transporter CrcB [Peribacillus asahii]USK61037.1 fluoride efflux transporter CrcB [Peribacillus asahii]
MNAVLVWIGGMIGVIARYSVQTYLKRILPESTIPLSILIINLVGSFGLGMCISAGNELNLSWQLFSMTGFLGAFTTFSTFSSESLFLLGKQQYMKAFLYITGSIIGCIFVFFIGNIVAMSLL